MDKRDLATNYGLTVPILDGETMARVSVLALAIWREARGEPKRGKEKVGQVIENRVHDKRWPETYASVIVQPWQFSAFNPRDPNARKFPDPLDPVDLRAYTDCVNAALLIINDPMDYAAGANHYLTKWAAKHRPPHWYSFALVIQVEGNHYFLKL